MVSQDLTLNVKPQSNSFFSSGNQAKNVLYILPLKRKMLEQHCTTETTSGKPSPRCIDVTHLPGAQKLSTTQLPYFHKVRRTHDQAQQHRVDAIDPVANMSLSNGSHVPEPLAT